MAVTEAVAVGRLISSPTWRDGASSHPANFCAILADAGDKPSNLALCMFQLRNIANKFRLSDKHNC